MAAIAAIFLAFIIGGIPNAYLLGKLKGIDIRNYGSGNIGATNAMRVLGRSWGIVCLALDIFKGWLPTYFFFPPEVFIGQPYAWGEAWQWALGVAAIAGHMFTPFMGFRGGKGVATSLGVMLAIAPIPLLIVFIVSALAIWLTGYVSVGSIIGAALLPWVVLGVGTALRPGPFSAWTSFVVTLGLGALIIWKHRANIERLRNGTEGKLFE